MSLYLEFDKSNYIYRRLFRQHLQAVSITTDLQPRKLIGICNLHTKYMYNYAVLYTVHVISQNIDGGATEADGEASAPGGPSVATPLALGPGALVLWVYISGKPLVPMLQLYNVRLYFKINKE